MRVLSSFLVLLLCCILAQPAGGAVRMPKTDGWMTVQTDHFTVYSNARKPDTRKLVADLERYREVLGLVTQGFQFDSEVPTAVYIFRNNGDFIPYKLGEDGRVKNWAGYFMERSDGEYFAFDASAGSSGRRVAYHEYVHSIIHKTFSTIPLWLNEGLAEYYSTFRFRAQSSTAEVGHPIEGHVALLKADPTFDLDALFGTNHASKAYNEKSLQGTFYAQSWMLVHYLASTDERRTAFGRFLTRVRAGDDPEGALLTALGMDRKTLAAELEAYVQKGSSFYWIKLKDDVARNIPESQPMDAETTLLRLARLQSRRGPAQLESVQKHIARARELKAPESEACTVLGYALEQAGQSAEAETQYRKAVEVDGKDAEALTRLGLLLVNDALEHLDVSTNKGPAPETVLEAQQLFRRALSINSSNIDALAGFGRTFLFGEGDADLGIRVLGGAATLRPFRIDILRDLSCLLAKAGNPAAAWMVIERQLVPKADSEDPAGWARHWALNAETEAANARVQAGDVEGAVAIMTSARTHLTDQGAIQWLDDTVRTLQSGSGQGSGEN